MKIKSVSAICKANRSIILYEGESCQWIGDGAAIFPLFGLPKMTEEHIFTMFDVPENKRDGFYFKSYEETQPFCFEDIDVAEQLLDRATLSIYTKGRTLEPLKTSLGITFINERYLQPFSDAPGGFEFYERISPSGQVYIAVKVGFMLYGLILPYDIVSDDFVQDLDSLLKLSEIALENKKAAELEKNKNHNQTNFGSDGAETES